MYKIFQKIFFALLIISFISGCKSDSSKTQTTEAVEKTTRRRPRYPGTQAHKDLIKYLSAELALYTDKIVEQDFKVDFLDEKNVSATNIIGIVNPERKKRLLLCAHFDTRKIAEKDEDESKQNEPILGADDGGSGVGILLEIARLVKENGIDIGVDFVLFDAEDNGEDGEGWCLGSEYWAKKPHVKNYSADFGILLDLVGAKNAEFGKEDASIKTAGKYLDKIWKLAARMSFGNYFLNQQSGPVMDDHINVINFRKIPMIDIINMSQQGERHGFDHYHHTHKDNMEIIDKNTLRAVGKVVTATLYNYNNGTL